MTELLVMVHAAKLVHRLPIVIRAFSCGVGRRRPLLRFQVKAVEMQLCLEICRNASGLSCDCMVEQWWPQMQHLNLAALATGEHDLLFTHADL